jgi:hypothetical protein
MNAPTASALRLNLRELPQLFNSMDPSPFIERDLDADAEEFITSWARELPPGRELELVITLAAASPDESGSGVQEAVRRYFATRATIKRLEFSQLMRRGRLSLGVGLLFLVLCLLLGEVVTKSGAGSAADIVKEGLTIGGWVAMWRPLEIYLYDWWPLYEERRQLERLARIRVRIVRPEARPSSFGETPGQTEIALAESAA